MGMIYTICSVCGQPLLISDFDRARFGDVCGECRAAQLENTAPHEEQTTRTYKLYQLDLERPEAVQFAFRPLSQVAVGIEQGFQLCYELVYSGEIVCEKSWSDGQVLDRLYQIFNIDHPADYKGRSLSISDIVILDGDSGVQCYYCEPIGFARLPFTPALP